MKVPNLIDKVVALLVVANFGPLTPSFANGAAPLPREAFEVLAADSLSSAKQAASSPGAPASQGGAATRGTIAPVLDSEKRAITKGGFVKDGPVIFKDIAEKARLTTWTHTMGTPQKNYILETTGSGVALLDYDNDGWLDIFLVNGSTVEALSGKAPALQAALFQ